MKEELPRVKCRFCGKDDEPHYEAVTKNRMIGRQLCFSCLFWTAYVEKKDLPEVVRVDGAHYVICPESGRVAFRRFGGAKFKIQFNDGRQVTTTNLWHQGQIPAHFRALLPDNAKFVEEFENIVPLGGEITGGMKS